MDSIGDVNTLREELDWSGPSVFAAEAEHLRKENERWQIAYKNLENAGKAKDTDIHNMKLANQQLRNDGTALRKQLVESEGDDICAVEMEELLEKINDSCNTDYDSLSDAIDYLLED